MNEDELLIMEIKSTIATMSAEQQEQLELLASHIRTMVANAGYPVGPLTIALLGAEMSVSI